MFKSLVLVLAVICSVSAKPAVVAYSSAPLVAAAPAGGVVTATSSQYIARNYNGLAAAPLVAAAYSAPAAAYPAPIAAAYTAPVAAPVAAPLAAAYTAPVAAPLAAAAYTAPAYYPYAAGYTALL